ncbi:hypothetical protein [Taibaiella sp. KBW10]|uniref:hypothetical protein n=1 Tax=Taibaiella sp. KBW10 TaxID=2153357 RepID=UPI000F5A3484|nr:hypothetical protein [Taibaiella sp. KBW10]
MKKLLTILTVGLISLTNFTVSNAASLTRESSGGSPGQSKASICTNQTCTGLTDMNLGSSISKFGNADGMAISFSYSFYPGFQTISLGPSDIAAINSATPGTYVTFIFPSEPCFRVKIKVGASPGNYLYNVSTICL